MMKKVFFAFAIAGMFGFAACGSNNTETAEPTDELNIEAVAPEMTEETTGATEEILEDAIVEAASEAIEEVVAQ